MAHQPDPQPHWPDTTDDPYDAAEVDITEGSAEEVLGLLDKFFHSHASPAVHAELRRFLADRGHDPIAGLDAFLDRLGFEAFHADPGRSRSRGITRAAELTQLLAQALLLPDGSHTRDVGGYRALEVIVRGPGHYWTTADVIDDEGSGHLEVTMGNAAAWCPPTLGDLQVYPGVTGTERYQPDGSLITACTTTSIDPGGVIAQRAILMRSDGTFIDVMTSNEDSMAGGRTRPTPPLDADTVLDKIFYLRP